MYGEWMNYIPIISEENKKKVIKCQIYMICQERKK